MNKIQYIHLLNLRGINEFKGITMAKAIETSGGLPTHKELAEVNQKSMEYYIDLYNKEIEKNKLLSKENNELKRKSIILETLYDYNVENDFPSYYQALEEATKKLS